MRRVGAGNCDDGSVVVVGDGDDRRVEQPFCLNSSFPESARDGVVVDIAANERVGLVIVEAKVMGDQVTEVRVVRP
jgi:hypothetical protein